MKTCVIYPYDKINEKIGCTYFVSVSAMLIDRFNREVDKVLRYEMHLIRAAFSMHW